MTTKPRRSRPSVAAGKSAAKPRTRPRPAAKPVSQARTAKRSAKPAPAKAAAHRPSPRAKAPLAPPPQPPAPSAHDLAVEIFERGFTALQRRDFRAAAELLSSVIETYPDEKELHERARVYITICERQSAAGRAQRPKTVEERLNAAMVAINRGAYDEGLELLRSVARDDKGNDLAHYMLAVVFTARGETEAAVPHLRQAMELNPENRTLAAQDSDLEALREVPAVVALLEDASLLRRRPTPATRMRTGR